jgi:uncharacterized protein YciI
MTLPPIHRQIVVPATPDTAFRVFTDRISSWWPTASHSVHGADATAAFRDGRLIETGPGGESALWGTVLDWQPPRSFRMTWHPGREPAGASTVTVTFAPVGDDATLVTVRHEGWEALESRTEYRKGWPAVLAGLATEFPSAADADDPIVLVLNHTPAPGVEDVFAHPGFAGHVRFLTGLDKQGVLVGAGAFAASGEGMTIVRVAGPAAAAALVGAAHYEDESVIDGVLDVRARPWVVMMHGSSLA